MCFSSSYRLPTFSLPPSRNGSVRFSLCQTSSLCPSSSVIALYHSARIRNPAMVRFFLFVCLCSFFCFVALFYFVCSNMSFSLSLFFFVVVTFLSTMCALRFNHCFLFLFLFFIIRVVYIVMYIYNVYTFFPYIYIFFMYIYIIHTSFSLLYYLRYCISSAFKSKYSLVYHYTVPHTFPLSLLSTSAARVGGACTARLQLLHTQQQLYIIPCAYAYPLSRYDFS